MIKFRRSSSHSNRSIVRYSSEESTASRLQNGKDFGNKNQNIKVAIYTKTISRHLKLDLEKYNSQHSNIEIKKFNASHDRFLIIDEKEVYHIGASLKDLGKKWFGFSKMDSESFTMMGRLNL